MTERLGNLLAFLRTGIWELPEAGLFRPRAFAVRIVKVLLLVYRGFQRDRCTEKASALTFYSLLPVVTVVAVFFGIAKGLRLDRKLEAGIFLAP